MNNQIEDLEDLSTPSKNTGDEIDELVFDEGDSLNNTEIEDLESFAKEEGMPQRVNSNIRVDNMSKINSDKIKDFKRDDKNKKFKNPENKKVKFNKKKLLIIPVVLVLAVVGIWLSSPKNLQEVKDTVGKIVDKISKTITKAIKNVDVVEYIGPDSFKYYVPKGYEISDDSSVLIFENGKGNKLEVYIQDDMPYNIIVYDAKNSFKGLKNAGYKVLNEEESKIDKNDYQILDASDPTGERTLSFYGKLEDQKTLIIKFYTNIDEDFSPEAKKMFEKTIRSYNEQ